VYLQAYIISHFQDKVKQPVNRLFLPHICVDFLAKKYISHINKLENFCQPEISGRFISIRNKKLTFSLFKTIGCRPSYLKKNLGSYCIFLSFFFFYF